MAHLLRNPNLPDYFATGQLHRGYIDEYEAANVVLFPQAAQSLDSAFWASLDVEANAALRKLRTSVNMDDPSDVSRLNDTLRKVGVDTELRDKICSNAGDVFGDLIPIYRAAFDGYRLTSTKAVFRLTTVRSENMHFDLYKEANDIHFARMFVNLDDQPRIWHTSWQANEAVDRYSQMLPPDLRASAEANELWNRLTTSIFGRSSEEWWDTEPRHIAFFDPGDAWIVDSRQVAHQIFYGRRALSLDFAVDATTMRDPSRHYLKIAERIRGARADAA